VNRTFLELLEGNREHAAAFGTRFDDLQESQRPAAVTVCCADSRVMGDHIWANDDPGRLFTCSNVGNRVLQRTDAGEVVSGDVLYPLLHTGTETAVVVGHTGCGAVTATYDALTDDVSHPPGITHCLDLLKPPLEPGVDALPADATRDEAIDRLVEYNVDRQVDALVGSEDVPPGVEVIGVVYDFQDVYADRRGTVHVVNVDGERTVEGMRAAHPEAADRVARLWEY
jgi:carbonic anhydrase